VSASPARSERGRRPRGSVTAEGILDAAERVAAESYERLTMRAVAAELAASPMALYRYFATKDDLIDALLDRVLSRFEPDPPTDDWLEDLRRFAVAHHRVLAAHPQAITSLFNHPTPGRSATGIGELALGILRRGGLTGADAVAAFSGLLALNYGWAAFATARSTAPPGDPRDAPTLRNALLSLPAQAYPLTVEVAEDLSRYGSEEHFERALGHALTGIGAVAAAGPGPRGARSSDRSDG
jgi:AcrR family transcriptional regulator